MDKNQAEKERGVHSAGNFVHQKIQKQKTISEYDKKQLVFLFKKAVVQTGCFIASLAALFAVKVKQKELVDLGNENLKAILKEKAKEMLQMHRKLYPESEPDPVTGGECQNQDEDESWIEEITEWVRVCCKVVCCLFCCFSIC